MVKRIARGGVLLILSVFLLTGVGEGQEKEGRTEYVRRMYVTDQATFSDACRGIGLDLARVDLRRLGALVDLDLALPGHHHGLVRRAHVLAGRGLDVDDPEVGAVRRGPYTQGLRLHLDGVADVDGRTEAHVDVLEVGACVLGDVLDGLAEGHQHDQTRRADEAPEAVGAGVARVLGTPSRVLKNP